MKLYTEEQLRQALWQTEHPFSDGKHVDEIIDSLTPIELPTDEEIGELRDEHIPIDEEDMWSERLYFTLGAKSMLDKIQGGNNEQ